MRTRSGLRIVTYKERFPYSGDPTSLRAQDPFSYGPYIIFVNVIDPKTGRQTVIQQLLHGNGNEYSIGKKVSHGCVRTNNSVMKYELSKEIKRGEGRSGGEEEKEITKLLNPFSRNSFVYRTKEYFNTPQFSPSFCL